MAAMSVGGTAVMRAVPKAVRWDDLTAGKMVEKWGEQLVEHLVDELVERKVVE